MVDDTSIEYDTPLTDENGELIETINKTEVFEEEETQIEVQEDSFYEDYEVEEDTTQVMLLAASATEQEKDDDVVKEGEEEQIISLNEETLAKYEDTYTTAKNALVALYTSFLQKGEITAEDNTNLEQLKEQYSNSYNTIKDLANNEEEKTLLEKIQEIKANMVGATTDEILDILTNGGRKAWLYKDDDNNVLIDATCIPELTLLAKKLNLIATSDEDASMITLTPNFIEMISGDIDTGVVSIFTKYYLSTSKDELSGGTWSTVYPTLEEQQNKFLWIKIVSTQNDGTNKESEPLCISAKDGIDGTDGVDGKDGVSVEEVVLEYAINTSTTSAPADGWTTSMPNYQENYYLWIRTRVKYSNSSNYVYSTAICDQSWKANQQVYSQYKQLQDKFSWIVKSGTSSSDMVLTDALYSVLTNTIKLTAKNINLNGYVSNEDANWNIDIEGNMSVKNLNVEGYVSVNEIRTGDVACSNVPSKVMGTSTIYVDNTVSDDNATFANGAHYNTLQGAIDAIPTLLDSYDVYVTLQKDVYEDIDIRGFSGGRIVIYFCSHTVYGSMFVRDNNCRVSIYGGNSDSKPTTYGNLKPSNPINASGCGISFVCESTVFCNLYYVNVYGKTDSSNKKFYYGVCCYDAANMYFRYGSIIGCDNAFRANSLGQLYIGSSAGCVNNYVFYSTTGGTIRVNNSTQCNSSASTKTYCSSPSTLIIPASFSKWDSSASTGSNDNTTSSTKIVTYKSTYGDTYRTSTYVGWKNDNTTRQGNYGYGNCNGLWFFGNQFDGVKGKTISKVTITINRQRGGVYASVTHTLKAHNYSSKSSGEPSYVSGYSQTFSVAVDNSITVTITNSTVLNGISSGTIKGFGLQSAYDSSHYSVCSGNATVKITYY